MLQISQKNAVVLVVACFTILISSPCSADDWKRLAKDESFWTELEGEYGHYAGAVLLKKDAETRLGLDQRLSSSHRLVAAILNPDEAEGLGRWRLLFSPETEIRDISANTYLSSGHKVSLKSEHILKEVRSGGMKYREFALPQFKRHCVIEVSYSHIQGGFLAFQTYLFGGRYPTRLSNFRLVVPEQWIRLGTWHQGYITRGEVPDPISTWESEGKGGRWKVAHFSWEMHDIPGAGREPYMPPMYDIGPAVMIGATEEGMTWDDVAQWYWNEHLREKIEPSKKIRGVAAKITEGLFSHQAKLRAICGYVRETVRYVDMPLTESGICPNDPYQVLRNGNGDCKDQAVLTAALARAVGLPARCALVRTRSEGTLDSRIAGLAHFNHMIVATSLENEIHWFDPTARGCVFGELPSEVQGIEAFVINDDGSSQFYITPLATYRFNRTIRTATAELSADGMLTVSVRETPAGSHARAWREFLCEATEKEARDRLQSYVDSKCSGAILRDWSYGGAEFQDEPLTIDYSFENKDYATVAGEMLVLKPSVFSEPELCTAFVNEARLFPVRMPRMECWEDVISIALPEGYEVQELPERIGVEGPLGSFEQTFSVAEGRVVSSRSFAIERLECKLEDYSELRQYLADVRKHWGAGVVLSRKM